MDVVNHSCLGYRETVFPLLSRRKAVFPNSTKLFILWKCKTSKACFSLSHRTFYLSNLKTSTRLLDFVFSCLPPSWNTIHPKPRFHSNRRPEVGIMQSVFLSLSEGRGASVHRLSFPEFDVNVLEAILNVQRFSIWPETEKFSKNIHCSLHMQECRFEFDTSCRND